MSGTTSTGRFVDAGGCRENKVCYCTVAQIRRELQSARALTLAQTTKSRSPWCCLVNSLCALYALLDHLYSMRFAPKILSVAEISARPALSAFNPHSYIQASLTKE